MMQFSEYKVETRHDTKSNDKTNSNRMTIAILHENNNINDIIVVLKTILIVQKLHTIRCA